MACELTIANKGIVKNLGFSVEENRHGFVAKKITDVTKPIIAFLATASTTTDLLDAWSAKMPQGNLMLFCNTTETSEKPDAMIVLDETLHHIHPGATIFSTGGQIDLDITVSGSKHSPSLCLAALISSLHIADFYLIDKDVKLTPEENKLLPPEARKTVITPKVDCNISGQDDLATCTLNIAVLPGQDPFEVGKRVKDLLPVKCTVRRGLEVEIELKENEAEFPWKCDVSKPLTQAYLEAFKQAHIQPTRNPISQLHELSTKFPATEIIVANAKAVTLFPNALADFLESVSTLKKIGPVGSPDSHKT